MHSGWSEGLKDFPALVCFIRLEVACDVKSSSVSLQTSRDQKNTKTAFCEWTFFVEFEERPSLTSAEPARDNTHGTAGDE